jgi:signal transduction histidine kinase
MEERSFAKRFMLFSVATIAGSLMALGALLVSLGFSIYVRSLNQAAGALVADVPRILSAAHVQATDSPPSVLRTILSAEHSPELAVMVAGEDERAVGRRLPDVAGRTASFHMTVAPSTASFVGERAWMDNGIDRQTDLALASVFGLTPASVRLSQVTFAARVEVSALRVAILRAAGLLALVWLGGFAFAVAAGRALTRQALRPLVDVTVALERLGAGDLTPRPIAADHQSELARLAVAYNGAIAQVTGALERRDRAEANIRHVVADAGHQLRSPLTVIRGFLGVLRRDRFAGPEDRARILQAMTQQARLMARLIDQLVLLEQWDSAELPEQPLALVDVSRLVESAAAPLVEAATGRTVRFHLERGVSAVVSPDELTHAIVNLLDNALKYATEGAIDVDVHSNDGRGARIVVTDEGPGMSADEMRHAFDRFYRGARRRNVEGSGLGLAIARRAVERAHGTLSVESAPQHGSRFTISLPPPADAAPGVSDAEDSQDDAGGSRAVQLR